MTADKKMDFRDFEEKIKIISKAVKIPGMESDDIAQELRLAVWKKSEKYNPDRGSQATFFNKIVRNRLIDLYRRSQSKKNRINNNHISIEEAMILGDDINIK